MLRRKLLLLSLLTIVFTTLLSAQVNVHGNVIHANGGPQSGVNILVSVFFSDSTFLFESAYTDVNGDYGVTIQDPPLNVIGFVEVSMVDCWGTLISQYFTINNGPGEIEADFVFCSQGVLDSCSVYIIEQWVPGAVTSLQAWTPANVPVTYAWSTGETTQTIFPPSSGEYCVTVTYPWGCMPSACYEYTADSSALCFSYITYSANGDGTYNLEAVAGGTSPFSYTWSTGDVTQNIYNVGPGSYCVTIMDANGCVFTTCTFIDDPNFCWVSIAWEPNGALVAIPYGAGPFTYLWNTGETTDVIYPNAAGLYCVTVVDGNQCSSEACFYYGNFPDSCYVFVTAVYVDTNTIALQAIGSSFADSIYYVWNTGETGETIYPADPSFIYCVTMTDSEGCVATGCFEPSNWCYAWVELNYVDTATAVLTVFTDPIFGWPNGGTYVWSNGATGSEITVTESGMYCVTATMGSGCVTESCVYVDFESLQYACAAWVYQYADSTGQWFAQAEAWGYGEFSYLWSTGDTTQVIELSSPDQFVCVTATNTFGCIAEACVDTFFNPCQVYVSVDYYSSGGAVLTAFNWNNPSQGGTYVWSNGATGPFITVNTEGTYCVTATGGGCISEACVEVLFWNLDSCGVWIAEEPSQFGGILYTAQAWGTEPFTYAWSNGSIEQSQIVDFGIHDLCVTVTDATGCVAVNCNYDPNQGDTTNIINGFIYADSSLVLNGVVHAYALNAGSGKYEWASSTTIENGNYYKFRSLPSGIYLVKAEILPGTVGYTDYLPSYHHSAASWETATPHVVPNWLTITTDIRMLRITSSNGPGVIGGVVTDPQNILAEQDGEFRETGIPNINVLLKDADGKPLNYKVTLQDGSFRFTNLPLGTYRLSYDIIGIHSPDVWVTLTHDSPEKLQISIVLDQTGTDVEEPEAEELELYPNPAREQITIKVPADHSEYHIQVVDMMGRIVKAGNVQGQNGIMLIDVGQYSPGLYHINLKSENAYYLGRFVKQE